MTEGAGASPEVRRGNGGDNDEWDKVRELAGKFGIDPEALQALKDKAGTPKQGEGAPEEAETKSPEELKKEKKARWDLVRGVVTRMNFVAQDEKGSVEINDSVLQMAEQRLELELTQTKEILDGLLKRSGRPELAGMSEEELRKELEQSGSESAAVHRQVMNMRRRIDELGAELEAVGAVAQDLANGEGAPEEEPAPEPDPAKRSEEEPEEEGEDAAAAAEAEKKRKQEEALREQQERIDKAVRVLSAEADDAIKEIDDLIEELRGMEPVAGSSMEEMDRFITHDKRRELVVSQFYGLKEVLEKNLGAIVLPAELTRPIEERVEAKSKEYRDLYDEKTRRPESEPKPESEPASRAEKAEKLKSNSAFMEKLRGAFTGKHAKSAVLGVVVLSMILGLVGGAVVMNKFGGSKVPVAPTAVAAASAEGIGASSGIESQFDFEQGGEFDINGENARFIEEWTALFAEGKGSEIKDAIDDKEGHYGGLFAREDEMGVDDLGKKTFWESEVGKDYYGEFEDGHEFTAEEKATIKAKVLLQCVRQTESLAHAICAIQPTVRNLLPESIQNASMGEIERVIEEDPEVRKNCLSTLVDVLVASDVTLGETGKDMMMTFITGDNLRGVKLYSGNLRGAVSAVAAGEKVVCMTMHDAKDGKTHQMMFIPSCGNWIEWGAEDFGVEEITPTKVVVPEAEPEPEPEVVKQPEKQPEVVVTVQPGPQPQPGPVEKEKDPVPVVEEKNPTPKPEDPQPKPVDPQPKPVEQVVLEQKDPKQEEQKTGADKGIVSGETQKQPETRREEAQEGHKFDPGSGGYQYRPEEKADITGFEVTGGGGQIEQDRQRQEEERRGGESGRREETPAPVEQAQQVQQPVVEQPVVSQPSVATGELAPDALSARGDGSTVAENIEKAATPEGVSEEQLGLQPGI